MSLEEIINFLLSPELQQKLFWLKSLCFFISFLCFAFLVFFLLKTRWLKLFILFDLENFLFLKVYGGRGAARCWRKISKKMNRFSEKDFKKAILAIDKAFGKVLVGLVPLAQTKTFEDRLNTLTEATIPNIKELRKVHQLAREIAKNPNYQLTKEEGKKILAEYEKALKELEII